MIKDLKNGDWILVAIGILMLFVSPGLALFYAILIGICVLIVNSPPSKYEQDSIKRNQKIKAYREKYGVSDNSTLIKYISGIEEFEFNIKNSLVESIARNMQEYHFWKSDKYINIISSHDICGKISVKNHAKLDTDKIKYYTIQGDKYSITDIQGGGSSLGKAIVGGAIAGGAGAVIASRKGVTSTTEVVDDRRTMIYYEDGNEKSIIVLSSEAYDYLLSVLPEKEYSFVMSQQKEQESEQSSSLLELEQLAELRDKGILTEEEFSAKKKQLLGI